MLEHGNSSFRNCYVTVAKFCRDAADMICAPEPFCYQGALKGHINSELNPNCKLVNCSGSVSYRQMVSWTGQVEEEIFFYQQSQQPET